MRYRILGLLTAWLAGASLAHAQTVTDFKPAVGFYHPMAPLALNPVMPQMMAQPMMPQAVVPVQWARPMPVGVPQPGLYPPPSQPEAPVRLVPAPRVIEEYAPPPPTMVKEKKRFLPWNRPKTEVPVAEPESHSGGVKGKFGWLTSKLRRKD